MTGRWENVLVTGDAHVRESTRRFDELSITVVLWDESVKTVQARGVGVSHDMGTWECDAVVRYPPLDDPDTERLGYALIDTDGTPTLTFSASEIDV